MSGDTSQSNGVNELMIASLQGNVSRVRQILSDNSHILYSNNRNGVTALDYAVSGHQYPVIDVMLGFGLNLDSQDSQGLNVLHRCVLASMLDKVEFCVHLGVDMNGCNSSGETALMMAVNLGSEDIVRYLIKMGCEVNCRNRDGYTALENAFFRNHLGIQVMINDAVKRGSGYCVRT